MARGGPPPMPPEPDRLRRAGLAAWSILGILLLAGVIAWMLYMVRAVFPPLALALLIIFMLNPLVDALHKRGIRRGLGTVGIYLIFIWFVVLAVTLLVPPLQNQWQDLQRRWPEIRENAVELAERGADKVGLSLDNLPLPGVGGGAAAPPRQVDPGPSPEDLGSLGPLFRGLQGFATGALHVLLIFVLAPIFALYLLIDLPKIKTMLIAYLPPAQRDEWLLVGRRCAEVVGGFFRGQLLVAAIVGVMSAVAFSLVKLPFWLPIGALAGFFNIIPLVGPFVGGAAAVVVAAFTGGLDQAAWAALAMLVVQQIDNHFISPKVMGRTVKLHPVAVMIALLTGATLAGFWGLLMAVPVLGVAKVIAGHYYETRVLGIPPISETSGEEPASDSGKMISGQDQTITAEAPRWLPGWAAGWRRRATKLLASAMGRRLP